MKNNTVFIIAGPTAVGKSDIALTLASKINGEIVNCDSVQLYKYMDIGSAKPSKEAMQLIPHHLYGIVEPDYNMSAATYQKLALACIDDILHRGRTPIVCGGTGLYLNSILYKMDFAGNIDDGERRKELEKMAEENGAEYMHSYLTAIDPASAARIHPNNIRKVVRAIEAFEFGDGIKDMEKLELNDKYDFKFFALSMEREWLYARINSRVLKLFKDGLMEEVEELKERGYTAESPAMKGIGYKEIFEALDGKYDMREAANEIMKNTRHYAKRQLTWLRRYDNVNWIEIEKGDSTQIIADKILVSAVHGEQ